MSRIYLSGGWRAPFGASPYRLRFELGGETFGADAPVPRFVRAFGRARQVALEAFAASTTLLGVVASPPPGEEDLLMPGTDGFAALAAAGLAAAHVMEWTAPLWPEEGGEEQEQIPSLWRAFDLAKDMAGREVLLWCAVAFEMAIAPKARVLPYLVDPDRGILLHVYDDRGMDVIALDRRRLLPLYRDRSDWLLDFDRPRMAEAFQEEA